MDKSSVELVIGMSLPMISDVLVVISFSDAKRDITKNGNSIIPSFFLSENYFHY